MMPACQSLENENSLPIDESRCRCSMLLRFIDVVTKMCDDEVELYLAASCRQ